MKYITSRTNPIVKLVTSLHTRKGRTEHKVFIAEGLRTCETLVKTCSLVTCYVTDAMIKHVTSLIDAEKLVGVTDDVMEKMSTAESPSGILCVFEIPNPKPLANLKKSVILHGIADPGNMGTLIRTVAALGLEQVICIDAADSWNPKVVHASVGTIGNVAIYHTDWATVEKYKKKSLLCALVVKDGKAPNELEFANTVLVIGNEARGLPDDIITACDLQCTLPMPGKTESLNAAVAGSVALYCAYLSSNEKGPK